MLGCESWLDAEASLRNRCVSVLGGAQATTGHVPPRFIYRLSDPPAWDGADDPRGPVSHSCVLFHY